MMRRYAWYKLYNLAKTYNKNLTGSDVQTLAGNVLLSALAIPPFGAADMARSEAAAEQEKERSMRMANLLGFSVVRTHTIHSGLRWGHKLILPSTPHMARCCGGEGSWHASSVATCKTGPCV